MPQALPRTPSGESIEKLRRLAKGLDSNPRLRKAIKSALEAMGLPAPLPKDDKPAKSST